MVKNLLNGKFEQLVCKKHLSLMHGKALSIFFLQRLASLIPFAFSHAKLFNVCVSVMLAKAIALFYDVKLY